MKNFKYIWIIGLGVTMLIIALPIALFTGRNTVKASSPWDAVPVRRPHVNHASLINGEFKTGPEVTKVCLSCHTDAAKQVAMTTHWTWKSQPTYDEQHGKEIAIGKANLLNNFCIGIQSNWGGCTRCHTGYGWSDANFDFTNTANVDCLACHDQSGTYVKSTAGAVADGVNLLAVAKSVGRPTRVNCGNCHFDGGGGNAVKHGDLDETLYYPTENTDIHMGRLNFQCTDCHQTKDHNIKGKLISVSPTNENQVYCTDCHDKKNTHSDSRINTHLDTVACQTCHVPFGAVREPTKIQWDWSAAGQDRPEDQHTYLKIKGSFVYQGNIVPTYSWYNGKADHYLLGDKIDPNAVTTITKPRGSINDPKSILFPFKVHNAKQPFDTVNNYLLQPKTTGEDGYWTTFNWDSALKLGSTAAGLPYSGKYGFASTEMYWPLTHMVAPKSNALQCTDCHGENAKRIDWKALGYSGDPLVWGGRK